MRWQSEISERQRINTHLDFTNTAFNISGTEIDYVYNKARDSTFLWWR
ncbi:MAG: hypothetical protein ABIK61_07125 [candidate division WOR-3 bacterium]